MFGSNISICAHHSWYNTDSKSSDYSIQKNPIVISLFVAQTIILYHEVIHFCMERQLAAKIESSALVSFSM